MADVDPLGPAMTAARRFAREWSDHHRVRGNVAEAIRAHYADGTPLESVITWEDHEGPLAGARAIVAAIDAETNPGTDERSKLVRFVVREIDPLPDV